MRHFYLASIVALLALTACNSTKKMNDANFVRAINEYLMKHGETCTVIDHHFPIDLPRAEQNEQYEIGPKLAALERAGLVDASDATAVVHGMLDPLRGSTPPQPVERYQLTANGEKYFRQIPGMLGQTTGFCYGRKSVDSIVKWSEPVSEGTSSQTEVTYTYKIMDSAAWAILPDVQQAFPDIRTTVNGALKTTEVAGLQLTSKGWEVPGQ